MSFAPIALTMPEYDPTLYAGYWMKAYSQGTTTPLNMATDATGGTTLAKSELDAQGFPTTAGSARFIPFIDGDYDLWLFSSEALADANDTSSAIQLADNLNADPDSTGQFSLWDTNLSYDIPEIILGSNDNYYRSLVDSNSGNDPTSSAVQWEELEFGRIWNTNITYSIGDSVYASDGVLYSSLIASNSGNDPTTSPQEWVSAVNMNLVSRNLNGLILSNNGSDTKDMDIAAGSALSDDETTWITLSSAIVKQGDAVWAVGTNAGGRDGVAYTADQFVHVWLIYDSTNAVTDVLLSLSGTAPTLPGTYDKKRLLGGMRWNSNFQPFIHVGSHAYFFDTKFREITHASGAMSTTPAAVAVAAPANNKAWLGLILTNTVITVAVGVGPGLSAATSYADLQHQLGQSASTDKDSIGVILDDSSQIVWGGTGTPSVSFLVDIHGYEMLPLE